MRRYRTPLSFGMSLVIHALAASLFLLGGTGFNGTGGGAKSDHKGEAKQGNQFDGMKNVQIIERERATEIAFEPVKTDHIMPKKKKRKVVKKETKECPASWYGGIGIQESGSKIDFVFKGYPAEAAGLVPGDTILKISDKQILGDPGTTLQMTVLKTDGQIVNISITRGKICY